MLRFRFHIVPSMVLNNLFIPISVYINIISIRKTSSLLEYVFTEIKNNINVTCMRCLLVYLYTCIMVYSYCRCSRKIFFASARRATESRLLISDSLGTIIRNPTRECSSVLPSSWLPRLSSTIP